MEKSLLMDLIAPQNNFCHLCNRLLFSHELYVCEDCLKEIYKSRIPALEQKQRLNDELVVYSACWYEKKIKDLVHQLKYGHDSFIAEIAGYILGEAFVEQSIEGSRHSIVVPVPTHPKRLEERGYNQAELIARIFAKTTLLEMDTTLVKRVRFAGSQVQRNRGERLAAMKDAFEASAMVEGKKILLVDDVLTTGATVTSCAEELKSKGAESVTVFTLCRA